MTLAAAPSNALAAAKSPAAKVAIAKTLDPAFVSSTAARLNATVNPSGLATSAHFEFGRSAAFGHVTPSRPVGSGRLPVTLSDSVTGLVAGATYLYRAVAVNAAGTVTGATKTIVVPAAQVPRTAPLVSAPTALATSTTATITFTVTAGDAATSAWVEYGPTAAYGTTATATATTPGPGMAALGSSATLTALAPGTSYHYRVAARNAGGTTYGADAVVTTVLPVRAPVITSGAATSGASGWSVATTVDPGNAPTTVWAEYGPGTAYGATGPESTVTGTTAAPVVLALGALLPATTYHVRIDARNAAGTTYGADLAFTTPAPGVFVSTTGSDTADGSFASPWRTLQKAAGTVTPGTTVYVRGGTYAGFTMTRSGTPAAPITFAGYDGETAVLTPAAGTNVVDISNAHDIVLRTLTIEGATGVYDAGVMIRNGSANVTVTDSTLQNNHSFGIRLYNATAATITNNTITHNDTGIQINFLGEGTVIAGNQIVRNDGMVINDDTPGNDNGGNAIQFTKSTGHVLVTNNVIHGNRAPSHDYGYDGGAFEIYAASNVTMDSNTLWDNQNVVETGTDAARTPCANNVFTHNVAYGGNDKSRVSPTGPLANGLLLRCASNMLVANNTLAGLDYWAYDISQSSTFSGAIDGLQIVHNVNLQHVDKVYAIETALPASDVIDGNVDFNEGGGNLASVAGHGNTSSLADLRAWVGIDVHGQYADPRVVDEAGADFRLAADSPALALGAGRW